MRALLCFIAIFMLLLAPTLAVNDVIVKYNKLFVGGLEYIVKGISYNPMPLGLPNQVGLCSIHQTFVANQYLSACYDSDFFDGWTYPGRVPAPPAEGWFSPLWERDLPKIAAMGVNTLRLYNVNPSNLLAYERYAGQYYITNPGKNHVPFLDACAKYGIKVIWPLFADYNYLNDFPMERLQFYMRVMVEEVGNHSALLMYAVGNELNYVNNSDYNSWVKTLGIASSLMNYARDYQRTYWNRLIPFTTGTDDNNNYYDWLAGLLPVDVFMPNAGYRGQPYNGIWNFYDLWSGAAWQGFSGWYKLSCKYQVPLLIGEMNPIGYEDPPEPFGPWPTGFPQLWRDLLAHNKQGAIGGFYFEYNDEPYKGNQAKLGLFNVSVACTSQGCSDQADKFVADAVQPKGWEYDAVVSGQTEDGKPYNYGADVFALLGRRQQTLETATNDCPSDYWDGQTYLQRGNYTSQYILYPPATPPRRPPPLPPLAPRAPLRLRPLSPLSLSPRPPLAPHPLLPPLRARRRRAHPRWRPRRRRLRLPPPRPRPRPLPPTRCRPPPPAACPFPPRPPTRLPSFSQALAVARRRPQAPQPCCASS